MLKGIAASSGVVLAKAYKLEQPVLDIEKKVVDPAKEIEHFRDSLEKTKKDIVDTAVAAGSFKTLAAALGAAGLVDALKGEGPFTVFAPTDEAFAKIPADPMNALLADSRPGHADPALFYSIIYLT